MHRLVIVLLVVLLLTTLGIACTPDKSQDSYWPTEGWQSSSPELQGMDSEKLAAMFELIKSQGFKIDSVTIIRQGYLVAEAAVYPYRTQERHVVNSCTKSVISALIGIAIEQGYIESVDQPLLSFFPNHRPANSSPEKEAITLEHVLMMASGLKCRDSYLYNWQGLRQMWPHDDWVQYILDLPMEAQPGDKFEYCNSGSFLLSAIIQQTTGRTALEFAQENLFQPLGIQDVEWPANPQGITKGWGDLQLRPHDMTKIGYLFLNQGQWDGQQIVPAEWVEQSTRKHIDATLEDGYGYQWWITDYGVYMALGYAGQFIFVLPEEQLVVAVTSQLADRDFYTPQNLLEQFIIPAIQSDQALPANPDGEAWLKASIAALAQP